MNTTIRRLIAGVAICVPLLGACTTSTDNATADSTTSTSQSTVTTSTSSTTTTSSTTSTTSTTTSTTTTLPPEPTVYEGTGPDVVEITKPMPDGPAIAALSHEGSSNFIVTALDQNLDRIEGVVNEIGAYDGTRPLDFADRDNTSFLEIKADGYWRIELRPIESAETFDENIEGVGDKVMYYSGPTGVVEARHSGESNFIVTGYTDRRNGMVNEIGAFEGAVPITGGSMIEVKADGPWSLSVR